MRHSGRRYGTLAAGAALALWLGYAGPVAAASIDPALAITGSVEFDTASVIFLPGTTHSSTMSAVSGGATTNSTVNGSTVAGSNPLNGTLTMINDGFGVTTAATSVFATITGNRQYELPFDINVTVDNNSLTDTFEVVFRSAIRQAVAASGADSFAEAEFNLGKAADQNDLFFSEIISDTFFGDEVDGVDQGTAGAPQSADKQQSLTFNVSPGQSLSLRVAFDVTGGALVDPGSTSVDATTLLSLERVTNLTQPTPVPLPAVPPTRIVPAIMLPPVAVPTFPATAISPRRMRTPVPAPAFP